MTTGRINQVSTVEALLEIGSDNRLDSLNTHERVYLLPTRHPNSPISVGAA